MDPNAGAGPLHDVTFLFTDIEDSTAAWDRDEGAMDLAQARHDAILRRAISTASGTVFSTAGDGLAAAFARADDGLSAAVTAQRALVSEPWPPTAQLRVRMGLHTGRAIERDGDYFGPAVIRAARLMSLVAGGRIVCSQATSAALGAARPPDVELVPVGTVQLKGLSVPEVVLAVRAPGLPETGEPLPAENPFDWIVPRAGGRLVGRRSEVEAVVAALASSWLVTLTGIGGVGKTRLATAVADVTAGRFPDGRAFVDLAPVGDAQDVARAVADSLRISGQPGEDLTTRIGRSVGDRVILVVLDNCEHLVAAVASLVSSLGATCRNLTALATSREHLHVEGERVIRIGPLPTGGPASEAVELLRDRTWPDGHDPTGAERDGLVEIAARLDGVPLALELAAARCRTLGVFDVAGRLRTELGLLTDRARPVARHQTLEAAIEWSYRLLTPAEQTALDRLSVFAGSFSLASAERVVGWDAGAVDLAIASLVDKSLIEHDPPWFRLLEPTRQYAERRLGASGELHDTQLAHTAVIVDQVGAVHAALHARDEADWVRTLDVLWPDVRTVVRRAFEVDDADTVTTIAVHLAFESFWRRPEAFDWISEAVERYGDRPGPRRHELLGAGGIVAWALLDLARGIRMGQAAMAADPDPGGAIDCLPEFALIGAYSFAGRHDEAIEAIRRTIEVVEGRGDRWKEVMARATLAMGFAVSGRSSDEAVEDLRQASALARATGNPTLMSFAAFSQGLLVGLTDPAGAAFLHETARAWAGEVRNEWVVVQSSIALAAVAAAAGDEHEALQAMVDSADELLRTGWVTNAWETLWGVIDPLHRAGHVDAAALCLGACEASGITRYAYHRLPDSLVTGASAGGDERLHALRAMGPLIPLHEIIRIAGGRAPVPPVMPSSHSDGGPLPGDG